MTFLSARFKSSGTLQSDTKKETSRLVVIDMFRGVAMLLMALDHSAYFANTGVTAESYGNVRPVLESWPHVLTGLLQRTWLPGYFFMLAGTSVSFFERSRRKQGWTEWQITRYLLIRACHFDCAGSGD